MTKIYNARTMPCPRINGAMWIQANSKHWRLHSSETGPAISAVCFEDDKLWHVYTSSDSFPGDSDTTVMANAMRIGESLYLESQGR